MRSHKVILIIVLVVAATGLLAQDFSHEIFLKGGKSKTRTITIKPGNLVTVGRLTLNSDTLRKGLYYTGKLLEGGNNTLTMSVNSCKYVDMHEGTESYIKVVPAQMLSTMMTIDTNQMKLALNDIDYLYLKAKKQSKFDPIIPLLLGSMALMILSPLICYDFKEHKVDAGRYKYWALGSTAGAITGFALIFTLPARNIKRYQFNASWPNTTSKYWQFKQDR
jgi:hypothetical protein